VCILSSLRGRSDRIYSSEVVSEAERNILIPDDALIECSDFTRSNYLKGGYDACGELDDKMRESTVYLDRDDHRFLENE
jgi:hypothetical protein